VQDVAVDVGPLERQELGRTEEHHAPTMTATSYGDRCS
jgi:hypothetical protein